MVNIGNDWDELLKDEFKKEYYINLRNFLIEEYKNNKVFPNKNDIFNALKLTPYKDTKVVILGQDPYHGDGQAHGLSFSVKQGITSPPSLVNIFKEIERSLNIKVPNNGYLVPWANQGVLLLNTVLTVRAHEANSHKDKGWEKFTDKIISTLNEKEEPVIFLLWGNNAKSKTKIIVNKKHHILISVHPSPLSAHRGFLGCDHFKRTNEILRSLGKSEIDWSLPTKLVTEEI